MNINLKPRHTIHCLHYGSARRPIAEVIPDSCWPGMWRIRTPDGSLSDMANLTRAKDAAFVMAQKGPPARDGKLLHWQAAPLGEPQGRPVVRTNEQTDPQGTQCSTARQRAMIDNAADGVPIDRVERFQKYVTDILRGFREIRDSSVRHACCAALLRYGSRR
jgi:hypothetical protein